MYYTAVHATFIYVQLTEISLAALLLLPQYRPANGATERCGYKYITP